MHHAAHAILPESLPFVDIGLEFIGMCASMRVYVIVRCLLDVDGVCFFEWNG